MIAGWKNRGDYWMSIGSPDFVQELELRGCLETPGRRLSVLRGVKKNGMWGLWNNPSEFLRQEIPTDSGFILRGCPDLSGGGSSTSFLPEVSKGEAGRIKMAF
jgi:hypothetical protein